MKHSLLLTTVINIQYVTVCEGGQTKIICEQRDFILASYTAATAQYVHHHIPFLRVVATLRQT